MVALACGGEGDRAAVAIKGSMRIRAYVPVVVGADCAAETERRLTIKPAGGDPIEVELAVGQWLEDPELEGTIVCDLPFTVDLPGASEYAFTVDGSKALVFTYADIETQGDDLRFLDPSQFYDPDSYLPITSTPRSGTVSDQ